MTPHAAPHPTPHAARRSVSTGGPHEPPTDIARAVRVGPIARAAAQARRCRELWRDALAQLGLARRDRGRRRRAGGRRVRRAALRAAAAVTLGAAPAAGGAQTFGTCVPAAERAGRAVGCFVTARTELGRLAADPPLYWHLDAYPTPAAAAAARDARSTVVESLGRVWLFTIAPADWRPRGGAGGTRVARIGPLPLVAADSFAAVYMEGVFEPGMQTMVHRHAGAEAWYTLEGTMCVETPEGTLTQRAGDPGVLVRGGVPMMLTGVGRGRRASLVLILQDATQPRSTPAPDWAPRGLCGA